MQSFALLLLLGSFSSLLIDARANHDDSDASVAKAKKRFQSYQSDPLNLLRGIEDGEYEQIYIQYHHCVWSEFASGDDDGEDTGCNGDGDEDNPWYMGNTQCYRANVAYSLYGVRSGDDVPDNACRRHYYINSFFTTNGMDYFGNSLGLENYGDATSQCTLADDGNGDEDQEEDGDNKARQHNGQLYPNAQSYTTYCSSGKFVTAMFSGAYCTGKGDLETLNGLDDLNDELDQLDCVLAYSVDDGNNADENDDDENNANDNDADEEDADADADENDADEEGADENGRRLEEEEDKDEENEGKDLWDLLSYSSTCSILEYPKGCPDPFGVKKRFDVNPRTPSGIWRYLHGIDWVTLILFIWGTLILLLTFCIKDGVEYRKKKPRAFGFLRGKSPSRRGRSRSPARRSDDDTVDTNDGSKVRRKKGSVRGFFSRKK
jgi:hypothetical protein